MNDEMGHKGEETVSFCVR